MRASRCELVQVVAIAAESCDRGNGGGAWRAMSKWGYPGKKVTKSHLAVWSLFVRKNA